VTFLFFPLNFWSEGIFSELLKLAGANSTVPYEVRMLTPLAIGRQQNWLKHDQIWFETGGNFWDYLLV
jgi:hypothetical protein